MALAIKNTPILKGQASLRFNEKIKSNEKTVITKEEITKIKNLTHQILSKKK
jgi:hypothetical protein